MTYLQCDLCLLRAFGEQIQRQACIGNNHSAVACLFSFSGKQEICGGKAPKVLVACAWTSSMWFIMENDMAFYILRRLGTGGGSPLQGLHCKDTALERTPVQTSVVSLV